MTSNLPFTPDQFFEVFAEYNRSLWFFALILWFHAVAGAIVLARHRDRSGRFISGLLAVQWAWVAVVYHGAFFTSINPAAWLFAALFLIQSVLFVWFGFVRTQLRFSASGSARGVVAWILIVYSLVYPMLVQVDGHAFPGGPTFGVPCPTTLLTIGLLFAAVPPWPRVLALIPILWAFVAGSAALVLGVRADLMLWVSGVALTAFVLVRKDERIGSLPGDDIVPHPQAGYTMAVTIEATPREVWQWLVQIGQGRGGFYTHEWVENLLRVEIHNADRIVDEWQQLAVGDRIRLTPDPYFGQPGQFVTVVNVEPHRQLVCKQRLANGAAASWAFVLHPRDHRTTRVVMRRRSEQPTAFDRLMMPGYVFMDRGMLRGLRKRAEMARRQEALCLLPH